MRRTLFTSALVLAGLLASRAAVEGQTLRDRFSQLFTFGECGRPLCLSLNAAEHGEHFIPSITQGEANLLSFVGDAIGLSLGNIPLSAATGGVTFRFEGGVPVATAVSSGPVFAERPQTIGRGRLVVGANVTGVAFDNVRGVKLGSLKSRFAHQNVTPLVYGDPIFENDYIEVTTDIDLRLLVTTVHASYGLTDRIDVGISLPFVRASLRGESTAEIRPIARPSPHGFPVAGALALDASSSAEGTSMGPGDVTGRVKLYLFQGIETGFAVIADARLPTGDEDNFHGAGQSSFRVLGAYGAAYGSFSPHMNAGVLFKGADSNDRLLATIGFDQLVGGAVTLAGEVATNFEMGQSRLGLPEPVIYTAPEFRRLTLTDIPNRPDHFVDASLGLKISTGAYRLIANALVPLADGGVRPRYLWTLGVERTF